MGYRQQCDAMWLTTSRNKDYKLNKLEIMKKFLVVAALMLSSVATFAQQAVGSISLKPMVGVNGSTLTKFDNTKMKVGFVGGAELEYQVTDMFSLTGGVLYSMQGVKFDTGRDLNVLGLNIKTKDAKTNLSYINVPILANVYVVPGLAVKLGLQPGFLVDDDNSGAKSFDLSMPVGLSYEYSKFVIDGRYNWGLTKVWKNADPRNSVFQITLGYKFSL